MSFKAKLFIEEEERNILNVKQIYARFADVNGRPTSKPVGQKLQFSIESTGNDSFFYNNMFSQTSKCRGEIIFYRRDGFSTLFKIEFANAQILQLSEQFNAIDDKPLHINISIGWGIMKMRGVVHEKTWNPNNPFIAITPTQINREEEEEQKITRQYITDRNDVELSEYKMGDDIFYVIESKNMEGETIDIKLNNKEVDFLYKDERLKDDTISDFTISSETEKIPLQVIYEEYNKLA